MEDLKGIPMDRRSGPRENVAKGFFNAKRCDCLKDLVPCKESVLFFRMLADQ